MGLRATPLVCGHAFTAEVRPQAGERVWCHTCFDYRHVYFGSTIKPTAPRPTPALRPRQPKRSAAKCERRPTLQVCSSCHLELPVVGTCGDCPEDLG